MSVRAISTTFTTAAILAAVVLLARPQPLPPSDNHSKLVYVVPDITGASLQQAGQQATSLVQPARGVAQAGIVPHHLLVAPLISAFFVGLEHQPAPKIVVVVGPDHPDVGHGMVTTSMAEWTTPGGQLQPNAAVIKRLITGGLAVIDEPTIKNEHGVFTPLPFIKQAWPSTTIVLLAFRSDTTAERVQDIAQQLHNSLGPHDLVLASVDFSHYKNIAGAYQDDAVSIPVVSGLRTEAAMHIPVDSPAAISLVLRFAELDNLAYQQLVHTNSAEFLGDPTLSSTTSYLTAYFTHR